MCQENCKTSKLSSILKNSKQDFSKKNVGIKIQEKSLEKEEKYLKLSQVLYNPEDGTFYLGRSNFIVDESDLDFLKDIEQHIHLSAAKEKIIFFENLVEDNKKFPNYETLKKELKEKKDVPNVPENQFFLKYNTFDLENIFNDLPIPSENIIEAENLIVRMFNFLAKKMPLEQLYKLIITIDVDKNSKNDDYTYYFQATGTIAIVLSSTWWDKTHYIENQQTCVDKNGTPLIHEFGHVLDTFSIHHNNNFFLINSLNIKEIFLSKAGNIWNYTEPISAVDLIAINNKLLQNKCIIDCSLTYALRFKFNKYIFKKVIDLVNKNKHNREDHYSYSQPSHRYFMAICALIPSNYVRKEILKANFETQKGISYALGELFAESFSFLISASDNEKNVFWEWAHDFFTKELFKE